MTKLIFNFKQVAFPNADRVSAVCSSICLLHLAVLLFSPFSLLSQTVCYNKTSAPYKFNIITSICRCLFHSLRYSISALSTTHCLFNIWLQPTQIPTCCLPSSQTFWVIFLSLVPCIFLLLLFWKYFPGRGMISSAWVFPSCNCAYLAAHPGLVVSDLNRRTDSSLLGLGKNRISLLDSSS